jgi:hypothetical protein
VRSPESEQNMTSGLHTQICTDEECSIGSGALYAWDHGALSKLLEANKKLLEDAAWPCEAEEFVGRVIREHISKVDFPNSTR